ncbi:hypothetical protein BSKO_02595 [Bryopsis sp. KO-2023]|nr:hypothetical protein BSKO_02595 [Bryopsis sp. KO-2023]
MICEAAAAETNSAPGSHPKLGFKHTHTLLVLFGIPEATRSVCRSTVKHTVSCLLTLLVDYRLSVVREVKAIDALLQKALETFNANSSFNVLLELLRDPPHQVQRSSAATQQKFASLVIKCLTKMTESMGSLLVEGNEQGKLDIRELLADIHVYFTAVDARAIGKPSEEGEKSLQMVKEILHEICRHKGFDSIADYVDNVHPDGDQPPTILECIDHILQSLLIPLDSLPTLSSEQSHLGHTLREERPEQLEEFSEDNKTEMGNGANVGDTTSLRVSLSCVEHAGPLQKATKQLEEPRRSTVTHQDAFTLLDKPISQSPLFVARTKPAYDSQLNLDHDHVGRPSIPNFNGPHAALGQKDISSRQGDVSLSMDGAKVTVQRKKDEKTEVIEDQGEELKNKVKKLSEQLASKEAVLITESKKSSILSSTVNKLRREIASIELVVHRLEDRVTASQAEVLRLNELLGNDKERSSAPARSSWEEEPNRSGDFSKGGFETGPFCIYSNEAFTNDVEFDQRAGQIVVQQESSASERDRLESQGLDTLQRLENADKTKEVRIKSTANAVGEKHCQVRGFSI